MKNSNPLISIIVPCYKVEPYLRRCLESILAQTYCYWEAILVDDGSPDDSGLICDQFAAKDNRVIVIHKQNEGVALARWAGVSVSKGEWILFVDGDDSLPPTAIDSYVKKICPETNIILGSWKWCVQTGDYTPDQYRIGCVASLYWVFPVSPWCHLYRASLLSFDCFNFKQFVKGQDVLMNICISFKNESNVLTTSDIVYHYNIDNPQSTIHWFRTSMDYAKMFNVQRKQLIPNIHTKRFARANTYSMWRTILLVAQENKNDISWIMHPHCQELLANIKDCKLPLTFLEKEFLKVKNHRLRSIISVLLNYDKKIRKNRYDHTKDL